jgi:hypothetical protein
MNLLVAPQSVADNRGIGISAVTIQPRLGGNRNFLIDGTLATIQEDMVLLDNLRSRDKFPAQLWFSGNFPQRTSNQDAHIPS